MLVRILRLLALTAPAAAIACNHDEMLSPTSGALRIDTATHGGDADLDGYDLVVDGGQGVHIASGGFLILPALAPGAHILDLQGLASNCSLSSQGVRSVNVPAHDTLTVRFDVFCVATGIEVTPVTSGLDADPAFTLLIDGKVAAFTVAPNTSQEYTRLEPGPHTVALGGVGANCVAENARQVSVSRGTVVPVVFLVQCRAKTAVIEATAVTDGSAILYTALDFGGTALGLVLVRPDGSGATHITNGPDLMGVWRP